MVKGELPALTARGFISRGQCQSLVSTTVGTKIAVLRWKACQGRRRSSGSGVERRLLMVDTAPRAPRERVCGKTECCFDRSLPARMEIPSLRLRGESFNRIPTAPGGKGKAADLRLPDGRSGNRMMDGWGWVCEEFGRPHRGFDHFTNHWRTASRFVSSLALIP